MTDDLDRVLADIDTLLPPGAPTTPSGACEPWEAEAMRWSPVDHDDHPDLPAPPPVDYWAREPWPAPDPQDSALTAARGITDRGSADVPYARGRRVPTTTMVNDWLRSAYEGRAAFAGAGWVAPSAGVYDLARDWPSQVPLAQRGPVGEPDRGSEGLFQRTPPAGIGRPDGVGVVIEQAARYSGWSEAVMRAAIQATADAYQAHLESLTEQAQHTTSNLQHHRDGHQQAQAVINARRHRNTGPQNPAGIDGRPRRHQHPTKAAADNARPATHTAATPVIVAWQDGTVAVGFDGAWV